MFGNLKNVSATVLLAAALSTVGLSRFQGSSIHAPTLKVPRSDISFTTKKLG